MGGDGAGLCDCKWVRDESDGSVRKRRTRMRMRRKRWKKVRRGGK